MNAEATVPEGVASKVSPLVKDLLRQDARTNEALQARGNHHPAQRRVDLRRYFDPAFAELEYQRLWKNVWQFACRGEDIPQVGDRIAYNVGPLSYIIVRVASDQFKAFHNSCLHRGTRLCDGHSSGSQILCPFHGWSWNLDGSLRHVPSRWDFPGLCDDELRLPEVKLGVWGDFVFINPDANAVPLEKALGVLPRHFAAWPYDQRFTYAHVRKRLRANWKVAMEAFMESYHTVETHQQILIWLADASTQYDVWDDGVSHVSRLISPMAVPSPHLGDDASLEASAAEFAGQFMMPGVQLPEFKIDRDSDLSPRAQVAQWRRQIFGMLCGGDFSDYPDALLCDSISYWMFPNFVPWLGEGGPIVYRFLPSPHNVQECTMEIRLTAPKPRNGSPCPPSATVRELGFDDLFIENVPEFGCLGQVFDQDMANIPRVQAGILAAYEAGTEIVFGQYQEQRIRHFHDALDEQLGLRR